MLSQRLMPTTAASMAVDSMATVDILPTHTPMAMDTQLLTAMALTGSTSVRLMLSLRLMPSMPVFTDMDTHLMDTGHTDTGHMLDMLPHTPMATATQQLTLTDIIKLCQ